MATRLDAGKLESWRRRMAKFQTSGATVAAFCRQQDITPAQFYYWRRQLRQVEWTATELPVNVVDEPKKGSSSVEVFIGEQIRVSLPASDPELLSCVLRSLQTHSPDSGGFQRLALGAALATRR